MSDEDSDEETQNFALEQELRDLYHSLKTGYRSIANLYKKVKEDFPNATKEKVREFLRTQDTYTKTFPKGGPGLGKRRYQKTMIGKLGKQLQMDLVIMVTKTSEKGREIIRQNDGYQNILIAIEVLSCLRKNLRPKTERKLQKL